MRLLDFLSVLNWTHKRVLGTLNCSFWWRLRNNNFLASKELSWWQLSRSGSIFFPRLESCKAFFTLYLLDIKNQFVLKHVYMVGPNYKLRKDIRYQLLTALNVQLYLYSWNCQWHDLKVRETRNENFTLLLGMGKKSKYVQRWFWWNLKQVVVKKTMSSISKVDGNKRNNKLLAPFVFLRL